jgi:hypothetical protein
VKRERQRLFPVRRLKRFGMGPQILKNFYSCTIESILTGCVTAWYGNCTVIDRKVLQMVVRTAQYISGSVRGRAEKLPNMSAPQVMDCSLCYHQASGPRA